MKFLFNVVISKAQLKRFMQTADGTHRRTDAIRAIKTILFCLP